MKNGVYILDHDIGFKNIKKDLITKYGQEETLKIWEKAGNNLEVLNNKYAYLPKKVKIHTQGNMFRNAALYLALKDKYPEDAMLLIEEGIKVEGLRIAKLFNNISKIPGVKYFVIPIFIKLQKSYFNEAAEFECVNLCTTKDEVQFNITKCPYCKYLKEIDCLELVHTFCDIDEYIYGNFEGFEFKRSGTIGTGADKCDFYLKRIK